MNSLNDLIDRLKNEERIFIQTHNFPDHDAVASAFGFQQLLKTHGIKTRLTYEGDIQRDSLKKMISKLNISIEHQSECAINETDKIIIVDGCKGNKNVSDLIGVEIAIIDHHEVSRHEDVPYNDIRPSYGACSSIIFSYFEEQNITINQDTATALLIGINMDTAQLSRGYAPEDNKAFYHLQLLADTRLVNSILRNYIQQKDLNFYRYAMDNIKISDRILFCYFSEGCNQNLMGILGDFFLALKEVDFVILCADNGEKINFSLRSEREEWNASLIIQQVLEGIGFGGGHLDMAGGFIRDPTLFDETEIYHKFMDTILKG